MRGIFGHNPTMTFVLDVTIIIWVVIELTVAFLSARRLRRPNIARQDHGSRLVVEVLLRIGFFGCVALALLVPRAELTGGEPLVFWLGTVLVWAGVALRLYAIATLGAFFTISVATSAEQHVITSGPYRLVRHPSYTGLLLIALGFGLMIGNWLGIIAVVGCMAAGLAYRIAVEERALAAQLGQPYQEYMRHTKRLIPFVM